MANQEPRTAAEIRAELAGIQPEMARLVLRERSLVLDLRKSERHEQTTEFRNSKFKWTVGENWKWIGVEEEEERITLSFWEWTEKANEVDMPLSRAGALAETLLEVVAGSRS